jgi:hemerythrin-like domain-containing protein
LDYDIYSLAFAAFKRNGSSQRANDEFLSNHREKSPLMRWLRMEEEQFFPLALEVLTPEDWTEIVARITREEDSVFGNDVAQEFAALRVAILK